MQSEFLYFDFVTLTTLPATSRPPSDSRRGSTALEALTGQIFLVTLVARLVTLWVRQADDER